jgi:hypothetical protein
MFQECRAIGMRRTIAVLPGRPSAPAQPTDLRAEGDQQHEQRHGHDAKPFREIISRTTAASPRNRPSTPSASRCAAHHGALRRFGGHRVIGLARRCVKCP